MRPTIVWFRRDLRLADNPALDAAVRRGGPVLPVFIWCPDEEGEWVPGAASRVWLHHSLLQLGDALHQLGAPLRLRAGPALDNLRRLIADTGAEAVFWNRCYEPAALARDTAVKTALREDGLEVESFKGTLLYEPFEVTTRSGGPFQVFTPFWRTCMRLPQPGDPLPPPTGFAMPVTPDRAGCALGELGLLPAHPWSARAIRPWQAGEAGALERLDAFLGDEGEGDGPIGGYADGRDFPAEASVSRLSAYLHFGEISPRQVWTAVTRHEQAQGRASPSAGAAGFLRQLIWREFSHHLLYHFPHTPTQPLRPEFTRFPWRDDDAALRCWQRGMTGYPIVDAGMRELWQTGWMHNRVRMLAASLLVKGLLLHWLHGARWFWDTLFDADLANNTLGWQWTAGCGADAAPYFRIFNPVTQGRRFDPEGRYVRRWVPELAALPDKHVHAPWTATTAILDGAKIRLGRDYPAPCIEHAAARERALSAWRRLRGRAG